MGVAPVLSIGMNVSFCRRDDHVVWSFRHERSVRPYDRRTSDRHTTRKVERSHMRPVPTESSSGPRAGVVSLLFVGVLTLISSCSGSNDADEAGSVAQAVDADLSGVALQVHHAVG